MDNLEKIIEACNYLLKNYPEAEECRKYLDSRISKESQECFKFGYFPNTTNIQSLISLVGKEILEKENLFFTKDLEDSLYPRKFNFCYFEEYPLIMPFNDPYGKVKGIVARTLLTDQERKIKELAKYRNTKNFAKSTYLFGLFENKQAILEKDHVFLVEGQFDVIKASENKISNIVAIGSCSLSDYQFSMINRYTDNLILLLDNDEAGEKGRKRIIKKFGSHANIQNFYLPPNYKDIDEYFQHNKCNEIEFIVKK